jgi:hypothetical protein
MASVLCPKTRNFFYDAKTHGLGYQYRTDENSGLPPVWSALLIPTAQPCPPGDQMMSRIFGTSQRAGTKLTLCVLMLIFLASTCSADEYLWASHAPASLVLTVQSDKPEYSLGEVPRIRITDRNVGAKGLLLNVTRAALDCDVFLDGPAGHTISIEQSRRNVVVLTNGRPRLLGPRQSVTEGSGDSTGFSPLTDWGIDLTTRGAYKLYVVSTVTHGRSNTIQIIVE